MLFAIKCCCVNSTICEKLDCVNPIICEWMEFILRDRKVEVQVLGETVGLIVAKDAHGKALYSGVLFCEIW